jgi:hypothetical protein
MAEGGVDVKEKALDEEKLVKVPVAPPPKSFTPFARLICTNQPC